MVAEEDRRLVAIGAGAIGWTFTLFTLLAFGAGAGQIDWYWWPFTLALNVPFYVIAIMAVLWRRGE